MLEYRVLGGFAVENGDGEISVGGPRQRRLVAMLLVHRDSVVSVDRLADVVFAGQPTSAAATTLRSYVARLRRVVEFEGSGSRVVTRAPGYRLEVPDEAVDSVRFEAALGEARRLLARRDAAAAGDALRAALGLWRGEAYAEFADEDWARGESQRLVELRMVAYESLADAQLAAGRTGEAVSLLEPLVADDPLRESLQARLMLALYRSGRQVEALRSYQAHRRALVDELGIDPSPGLAELEGRILAHDESLADDEACGGLRGYRVGERLGTGRDGTVVAARQPDTGRDVAIRIVPEQVADGADFVRTFDADARRVAALGHDAVVPIHDWWREPGAAYVVMARMRGGSLRERLQAGPLTGDEAAEVVVRVGGALAAAAEAGIHHGRVSAASVLFDDAGQAYLGDFPLGTGGCRDGLGDLVALAALTCEAVGGVTSPLAAAVARLPAGPPTFPEVSAAARRENVMAFVAAATTALAGAPAGTSRRRANPYKGLRAFDEPDAGDFFGRDRVVDELVGRLGLPGPAGRFSLVVGASGSGKSSLVRAGLLPRLRRGAVAGSDCWFVATMVPGKAPFAELADALRLVAVGDSSPSGDLAEELAASESGLVDVVGRLVPPGGELLLVIDQLEELFTLAPEADQRAFLAAVVAAADLPDSRVRTVATLRADFYDRPLAVEGLAGLTGEATVAVGAMSATELEAAIVGPARRVGATVEPALVAELVGAVVHEPAALPALQFTLTELADRCNGGPLALDAYRSLGGLSGAIAARAEDLYLTLRPEARVGVRRMFEQLVVVGPEGEPTRRRALASEVEAVLPDGDDEAGGGEGAVELWAQARLLTLDRHPESRAPTVEVAHEALLREWPRLHDWLEEDREDIVALAHLREAAAGWEALDRDPGGLYRGVRLEAALGVAKGRGRNLPPAETAFLDASRAERDAERRREVGRVRRLRAQLVAVAAALVVSLVVGAIAVGQRDRASDQSRLAESRELAAAANANLDVDPERSVLLALEAVERSRTGDDAPGGGALPEAVEALHTAVTTSRLELRVPGIGGAVAWSPAGDTFVTEGPEGSGDVDIRDVGTGESVRRWPGHDPDVNSVAYGPEGTTLLTTGDDGAARLWDPSTGEQLHVVAGEPGDDVWGPSVSPDGLLFAATWPTEGVTRVAEVATGRVVREVTSVPMPWQTAFSPDGSQLVVSSSDSAFARVVVIDVASGDTVHELANRGGVLPVAWSPDGSTIAVGSAGGVQLWDAASGQRRFALLGHEADVNDVDWSPDSAALASSGADGEVKVWVLLEGGGRELFALSSQEMRDGVLGVAFSPDGSRLVTGNRRVSATRVWNVGVGGDAEVANVPGLALRPTSAAFLGQGRQAVASGPGRTLTVWDVADARAGRTMGGAGPAAANPLVVRASPKQEVETIAVDREGTVVAMRVPVVGSLAWDVSAWDPRTGRELFAVRVDDEITNMRWSRDGRYLALSHSPLSYTRSGPRHVSVRDRAGREVADLAAPEGFFVSDAAFTADGRRLATAHVSLTGEGTSVVATWDWRAGREVGSVDTPDVEWTILGVDATRAVSLRRDGRVAVWDVTGRGEPVVLDGRTVGIEVLALSTDGRLVAGGGGDGTVRLWDARDGTELVTLRGHIGAVTDLSFRRDDRQLASSSVDGRTRIWALHLDDLEEIARRELTRGFTTDECRRYLHVDACADA